MKKKIALVFALVFALLLAGCKDAELPPPDTSDSTENRDTLPADTNSTETEWVEYKETLCDANNRKFAVSFIIPDMWNVSLDDANGKILDDSENKKRIGERVLQSDVTFDTFREDVISNPGGNGVVKNAESPFTGFTDSGLKYMGYQVSVFPSAETYTYLLKCTDDISMYISIWSHDGDAYTDFHTDIVQPIIRSVQITKMPGSMHDWSVSAGNDNLYPIYHPAAGILSFTPGDGTFMDTRSADVAAVSNEFMEKYAENRSSLPPLVYYVIHKLNLTRNEVEYYYKDSGVTKEYIDALFCPDEEEAKQLLRSPYAFQVGDNLYNVYELMELTSDNIPSEIMSYFYTEDFYIVCANIMDYLGQADPAGSMYSQELVDFVNRDSHGMVDAGDELLSPYSGYVDGVVWLKGTFSENYGQYMSAFAEMEGKWEYNRPAVMYHLAREMNLTREDLETYYTALGYDNVPDNIYTGLLTDSLSESMQLLKTEYAFYNNGKLYTVYDIYKLYTENLLPFDATDTIYDPVWKSIDTYLKTPFSVDVGDALRQYVSKNASSAP